MRLLSMGFCSPRARNAEGKERTVLYLNVYDLTPINNYLYWLGLGIFHSGIEVHGMEYGYGAHDYPSSGVFEVEPRTCPGFIFRKSILLGTTDMTRTEFRSFIEQLASAYHGNAYHLIGKNCNHFTDDVCMRLTGIGIPGWINRLARLGSFFNCFLPEQLQLAAVRHSPTRSDDSDSASSASIDSEDNLEAAINALDALDADDHQHLLSPRPSEVSFVKEFPVQNTTDLR